jgi:hypothetical protein
MEASVKNKGLLQPVADSLVPAAPVEWLRECLDVAFPLRTRDPRMAQLQAQVVPSTDRRSEERAKFSVYRSAVLRWDGLEGLCLIRNISSGGLMGKVHAALAPGQMIEVEMRSGVCVSGRVVWSHAMQVGIEFDERIDVHNALNPAAASPQGPVQRMPRLNLPCPAALLSDGTRQAVTLLDLSQGGAKVEAAQLCPGDEVIVSILGLEPQPGMVRWTQDGRAGIAFNTALSFDALARWAMERQGAAA